MYFSKHNNNKSPAGFSLLELIAALMIVSLITSTVLVTINRYSEQTINRQLTIQAFNLARENMEKILASDTVEETLEYSSSDEYPDIQTTNVVETFLEPQTERMWIRAVCSASFTDSKGQEHSLDFTHWVTDLSVEQMIQVLETRKWQQAADEEDNNNNNNNDDDDDGTQPPTDGTNTSTTSNVEEESGWEPPEGWDSMSRIEKLKWLWQDLLESRN